MFFKRKGEQGYISFMKTFNLMVAAVLFVIAAVIFCIGLAVYDSKGNVLTIIGAVFVIPAARFITVWILFLPFKSVSQELFDRTYKAMKGGNILYCDVLLTSTERAYCASFIVITSDKVLVYSTGKKYKIEKFQEYLDDIIKRKAFDYKVTCTDDESKFMSLLKAADSFSQKTFENDEEKKYAESERSRLTEVLESYMP